MRIAMLRMKRWWIGYELAVLNDQIVRAHSERCRLGLALEDVEQDLRRADGALPC
jgi:hypothetical protein